MVDDGVSKSAGFYVHIAGRVECGQLNHANFPVCSYEFVTGPDWIIHSGIEEGETQHSKNQVISEEKPSVVWNFPMEISFNSTNISGWPRIALTVRDINRDIIGYATCTVPPQNGTVVRYCNLFKPLASSHMGDFVATLSKDYPEFYDPRITSANTGREATRVASDGVVKITISTKIQGAEKLGFAFS